MQKLALFMMTSIDGLHAGREGSIEWHQVDDEFNRFAMDQIAEFDTIAFGRVTYEGMASWWPTAAARDDDPGIARLMNSTRKVVVSRTLPAADWENTTLMREIDELAALKEQPGRGVIVFGSSNLCASLADAGLLDELRIMVAPVLLGTGESLLSGLVSTLKLDLRDVRTFGNGNVLLTYARA